MIGQPKVDDLHIGDVFFLEIGVDAKTGRLLTVPPEHNHDVVRLEVAVADMERMEIHDSLDDPADDIGCDILGQLLLPPHVLVEVLTVDVLSDDVDVFLAPDCLLVLHYLRVRYHLHYLALVVQCRNRLTRQLLSIYVLQGVHPSCPLFSAPVNN